MALEYAKVTAQAENGGAPKQVRKSPRPSITCMRQSRLHHIRQFGIFWFLSFGVVETTDCVVGVIVLVT